MIIVMMCVRGLELARHPHLFGRVPGLFVPETDAKVGTKKDPAENYSAGSVNGQ